MPTRDQSLDFVFSKFGKLLTFYFVIAFIILRDNLDYNLQVAPKALVSIIHFFIDFLLFKMTFIQLHWFYI